MSSSRHGLLFSKAKHANLGTVHDCALQLLCSVQALQPAYQYQLVEKSG